MVVILAPGESRQKITLGLIFFSVFLDLPRDSFEIFRSVFITDEGGGGQREVGPVLKVSDGKWIVTKVQRGEVRSLSGPL